MPSHSRIGLVEVLQLTLDHVLADIGHGPGDVVDQQRFSSSHQAEQRAGVAVVVVVLAVIVAISRTVEGQRRLGMTRRCLVHR
jgi:hypothetical protein